MEAVRQCIIQLLKGCKCKTGCTTSQCGCRKKNKESSEGCEYTNCSNTQLNTHTVIDNSEDTLMELSLKENFTEIGSSFWMIKLTKLQTMSLGPGPGSSTAISSTAVLSTLDLPNPVSSMQQYKNNTFTYLPNN